MNYKLSAAATEDIIGIYLDGIEAFGIRQAEAYHAALKACFDLLSGAPLIARERTEFTTPVRVHPFKSHVILYRIESDDILIIRVRHGREDWLNSLE